MERKIRRLSRRQGFVIGGLFSSGVLAASLIGAGATAAAASSHTHAHDSDSIAAVVKQIENIEQADGHVSGKVLEIDINRTDVTNVKGGPAAVPFVTGFVLKHQLFFQPIGHGKAAFNGDVALKPSELQPVIDAIEANGLTFQAEHQHLYDLSPMMWFVHFRGTGDPLRLARAVHNVIKATSTPLPQSSPAHPTTPLPAAEIGKILGGNVTIGKNGVVTVMVPRKNSVILGGVRIDPGLGVANAIEFEPLAGGKAAAVPDFSMTAPEVNVVTKVMRRMGWTVECLYNQEIGEYPQLYFSHMFKTGDPVTLARQIHEGLEHSVS